jgi:tetratricopeptide (TPR) repeat protein
MRRLVLFFGLAGALSAWAAQPKASAFAKEADRLYKDNKYREAAETLRKAYDAEPIGLYLYNIARAYDQATELKLALDYYRRYVSLPSPEVQSDLVRRANLSMDRLRTLIAKDEADKAEKARLQEESSRAEARAEAEAAEARKQRRAYEAESKERKALEAQRNNVRMTATWIAGGITVAALGAGVGFGIAASGNREAFRTATTLQTKQTFEQSTKTTAAIADVSMLVSVAAAVSTIILFPKGSPDAGPTLVWAPVSGGLVAGIGGRF